MRYKNFARCVLGAAAEPETREFSKEHFREAGVPAAPLAGMPLLEAHELVNKWNRNQSTPRFVYFLP